MDTGEIVRVDVLSDGSYVTPRFSAGSATMSADGNVVVFTHHNLEYAAGSLVLPDVSVEAPVLDGGAHVSSFALPVGAEFTALPDSADLNLTISSAALFGGAVSSSSFRCLILHLHRIWRRPFRMEFRATSSTSRICLLRLRARQSGVSIVLSLPDGPISIDASFSFDPSAQQTHVYHKDLTTGELSVVDITPSGTLSSMEANSDTHSIDVSDDGSLVAFQSQAEGIQAMVPGLQHHFWVARSRRQFL